MQARLSIAFVLTALVAGMAACDVQTTVVTGTKASKKPTASASPVASPSATPVASASPSPSAKPSGSPSPSEEPGLPGSPPPFKFPYTAVGQSSTYTLKVKAGAFPIGGTITIAVAAVSDTGATVKTTMALDSSLFGGGNKPTESEATIKKTVDNPFSLTALLQGKTAALPGAAASAAASAAPAIDTSSTIRKWAKEPLQVDAGSFDTIKYFIDQKTGADITHVTLWVDEKSGQMVKEQVDSDKPPDLGNSLPIPPGVQLGKTSTTLLLKSQATPGPVTSSSPKASVDPNASGAASPTPTPTADTGASGAASPTPTPTPTAQH
ncbi:MAG: hypothetical protein JWM80_540 [Cyanobacteria bacterium RYN_339]|nr:hypothetical protein [Cyanobacteria bacterium RYN_339]